MSLQLLVCGFDVIEVPNPAPVGPATPAPWIGVEPDGTPLGDPLVGTVGTTFTATVSLGRSYPSGTLLSATIEEPPGVPRLDGKSGPVRVPHAEWVNAPAGQLLVRIAPHQMPWPGFYRLIVRTTVAGVTHVVRDSALTVNPAYTIPPESP